MLAKSHVPRARTILLPWQPSACVASPYLPSAGPSARAARHDVHAPVRSGCTDRTPGEALRAQPEPSRGLTSAAVCAYRGTDSCGIVAGCRNGVLVVWEVNPNDLSGKPVRVGLGIAGGVTALACAPNGRQAEGPWEVRGATTRWLWGVLGGPKVELTCRLMVACGCH